MELVYGRARIGEQLSHCILGFLSPIKQQFDDPRLTYEDFVFIDTRTVMLAANGLADSGSPTTTLQVWYFDRPNVFHIGSFALPSQTYDFESLKFDGGPWLSLGGAKTLDGTPFAMSPASDILAVSMRPGLIADFDDGSWDFTMVMRLGLMFDVLGVRPSDRVESFDRLYAGGSPINLALGRVLEWGKWGPQCTRWFPQPLDHQRWDQQLVGGRFVSVPPAWSDDDGEPVGLLMSQEDILLYDFRPEIVARYAQSFPQDVCTETSLIPLGALFYEDIFSNLPYHVTSKELPCVVPRVTMDDGRLICTEVNIQHYSRS